MCLDLLRSLGGVLDVAPGSQRQCFESAKHRGPAEDLREGFCFGGEGGRGLTLLFCFENLLNLRSLY